MAHSISKLIEKFTSELNPRIPGSEIVLNEDWNSAQPDFRQLIRQDLYKKLTSLNENPATELLDLKIIPRPTNYSVSISHCALAGGYALSAKPKKIGFDIEDFNRDVTAAAKRISSEEELLKSPHPMALWVAKESILKALQLPLVAEAKVSAWKTLDKTSENFLYEFAPQHGGQGFVYQNGRLILGLAIFPA